ncbi:AMP-binding protein [Vibrio sp. PP-XX7]
MSLSEIQSQSSQVSQLFDHFIAFENYPASDHDIGDKEPLTTGLYADEFHEYMPTSYPFHLAVLPTKKSLQVLFKHIPKKIESDNVRAIADSFCRFVRTCLLYPEMPISQIALIESAAAADICYLDEGPEQSLSASDLIAFYLQQTTQHHPSADHVALVEGDKQLTHQQLAHASLKLAHLIQDKLQGKTVAIYDGPGIGMGVAMFACFRLGIPYVPLDLKSARSL